MNDIKKYNIFITITSFTKLLIEVFTPVLLFNMSFTLKDILMFLLYQFITIFTCSIPSAKLGNKISFKKLMIISSVLFSLTYLFINFMKKDLLDLIILAVLNGVYLITYWLGRHVYGLSIIKDKKTTDNVSLYMIFGIIGSLPASYIGAKILNSFGYITLSIVILTLSLISIIPLAKIKYKKNTEPLNIKEIIKTYPRINYIFYFLDQFKFITISLFPLYIYLNISDKLEFIGITNLIVGLSSIIYIHILSKKMDKNKKNYLKSACIFLALTLFIKLNIKTEILMLIVIFIEGLSKSALDTIILRNTYSFRENYENISYITFIEMIYSIFRILILLTFIILNVKLKMILYIGVIALFINSFITFKEGKSGYKK